MADEAFLCAIRKEGDECRDVDGRFGSAIVALAMDTSGALWACGIDRVWRVKPAPTLSYPLPWEVGALQTMVGTPDGGIAIGTRGAIVKIANGQVQTLAPRNHRATACPFTKALSDRDGGLWIATSDFGLLHLHEGRVDAFNASDGLSGDQVLGLFEDREGNVWVSTSHGLDRFRPMAAAVYSRADGIKGRAASIIAAHDGSLWASTSATVYRLDHGQVSEVRPVPLGHPVRGPTRQDVVRVAIRDRIHGRRPLRRRRPTFRRGGSTASPKTRRETSGSPPATPACCVCVPTERSSARRGPSSAYAGRVSTMIVDPVG